MQVHVRSGAPAALGAAALIVPVFADARLDGVAEVVDAELGGAIAELFASKEIAGSANEVALIHATAQPYKRVLVVGLGKREKFKANALAQYAGTAVRYLGKRNVKSFAFALPLEAKHHTHDAAAFLVEGAITGVIDSRRIARNPKK